ncbi:MAG: hypothetical protein Q8L41_10765 [Anaerolineales bacterium]|nr:hypothetical protein [Anaerolineales bacterium]
MKKPYTSVVSLLGMFFILSVAIGLENWIYNLRKVSQIEFSGALSWLVPANIATLLMAGLLLVWLWFVYNKDQNIRSVAIIYVLAGLGFLFYSVFVIAFTLNLPIQLMRFPNSLSAFVSAVVAVVGLQKLFSGKTTS